MNKDNLKRINRIRFLLDLIAVTGAYFLTFFLFFYVLPKNTIFGGQFSQNVTAQDYELAAIYVIPLHLLMYAIFRLYKYMRFTGRRVELLKIFSANFLSIAFVMMTFWLFVKDYRYNFSSMFLFEFGVINTILVTLERNLFRIFLMRLQAEETNKKLVLLVGYSEACDGYIKRLQANPRMGTQIYGILDDSGEAKEKYSDYYLGKIDVLSDILSKNEVEEVAITLSLKEYEKLEGVVKNCEKWGVFTKFIPDYGKLMSARPYTENFLGLPVIYLREVPLNDMLNAFVKRAIDIFGSLFAIILFSPLMLVISLIIKLTSKGPLIFKQERIGLHNKPFMMYKFRSMVVQTEAEEKKGWTTKNDSRITPIGKFIRKTSIDELPQLFNVLSGKMSLIGPRPERPQYVDKFKEEIPRYMVKHQVRPGMTGWAQVNGLRGDTSIEERIKYDIEYIENWTLGLDIKILFLTFFKGFVNKNAY